MQVDTLPGVGKKTLPLLKMLNINTVGDLANYRDIKVLEEVLGPTNSRSLIALAHGEGSNVIDVNRFSENSSISNSQTFDNDEYDISNMKSVLKILSNSVSYRLEKAKNKAYTFTVQIKYSNYHSVSRCRTLNNPINNAKEMYLLLEDIFDDLYDVDSPTRLVGVSASKLITYNDEIYQISIFDNLDEKMLLEYSLVDCKRSLMLSKENNTRFNKSELVFREYIQSKYNLSRIQDKDSCSQ
jgi:DNA polymerase-4